MSDEVAPERFGDDALAGFGQALRRATLARSVHAAACPESDGVAGAVRGFVVAEALVPDAAHYLAGNITYLPLQEDACVGSAGEGEFHQLGLVGGDLHAEVHIGPELIDHDDQPL